MKQRRLILVLSMLFFACITARAERLVFPLLLPECQSNIVITADPDHRRTCPPEYTNLISNTNLFSPAERKLLKEIPLKYKEVTTNSGPDGTVFNGYALRQWTVGKFSKTFQVSCFAYTNSAAQVEIAFMDSRQTIASFRTQSGDGYDVNLIDGRLVQYQEHKNGVLDGLLMKSVFDADHCNEWARFVKGKILGKYIMWDGDSRILAEAEFKKPFYFVKCAIGKFDLTWEKVVATQTNSILSSP